jgi:hypothetical protein
MRFKVSAVAPGSGPVGHPFATENPGAALTQVRALRRLHPGASAWVEMEGGQEISEAELERLRAERDAADHEPPEGRNA